jgi:hypothetical protein
MVENAVRHGLADRPEGGRIALGAHLEAGQLVLTVDDDGTGALVGEGTGNRGELVCANVLRVLLRRRGVGRGRDRSARGASGHDPPSRTHRRGGAGRHERVRPTPRPGRGGRGPWRGRGLRESSSSRSRGSAGSERRATVSHGDRALGKLRPDLVFLDVQLPGGSGLDVLRAAEPGWGSSSRRAHDRFAVTAFELGALDYLRSRSGQSASPGRWSVRARSSSRAAARRWSGEREVLGADRLQRLFVRTVGASFPLR